MIDTISVLLQDEKFKMISNEGTILLFKESISYPEDYIQIENASSKFIISEVHRDAKQIKLETENEHKASIYAAIFYKRLYDDIVDKRKVRDIRNWLDAGEEEKALDSITNEFTNSVFSIDYEDKRKVSLIHVGNKVDVKFGGEYLAQNSILNRGYVVLYNYCSKLKHISLYYDEMCRKLTSTINQERIFQMYILGK